MIFPLVIAIILLAASVNAFRTNGQLQSFSTNKLSRLSISKIAMMNDVRGTAPNLLSSQSEPLILPSQQNTVDISNQGFAMLIAASTTSLLAMPGAAFAKDGIR